MIRLQGEKAQELHPKTLAAMSYEQGQSRARTLWKNAVEKVVKMERSGSHYQNQLNVCVVQHMSSVDVFDGRSARNGEPVAYVAAVDNTGEDLVVVSPTIDGRFRDEGRE